MPKASIHEYGDTLRWENEIGLTWQIAPMQPVAQSARMEKPADGQLGLSVFATNSAHHLTSLFPGENVHLKSFPRSRSVPNSLHVVHTIAKP